MEIAGSQNPEKQHRSVPLATTKIFTGYWPNSAPYRDAAVPYLYEKFYGASRNDKIGAGLNFEVSPQMTGIRRPGNTVWNSNNFSNVTGFYSFRPFVAGTGEQVYVMIDTTTGVFISSINGVTTDQLLYTKAAGAGRSRFIGEGNTLYWGDGVSTVKWSWFPQWTANTFYPAGTTVLSSEGGSFQIALGYGVAVISTSVTSNIMTVNYAGGGTINQGDVVSFYGMSTHGAVNNTSQTVLTATSSSFTVKYVTANYTTVADTGYAVDDTVTTSLGGGTSGATKPPFFTSTADIQFTILDHTVVWENWGTSVQNMGIVAPTVAPTVSIVSVSPNPSWAASTYYWPTAGIVDSNSGTGPWLWELTTDGTTNGSVPAGLTTGTPTPTFSAGTISPTPTTVTDGTSVWTCNGLAARQTSTVYSVGQCIMATWTYVWYTYEYIGGGNSGSIGPGAPPVQPTAVQIPHDVTYTCFFQCIVAGTTSTDATSAISWSAGLNGQTNDGTGSKIVWQNIGREVTRLASATVAPTGGSDSNMVAGNVGDSELVTQVGTIFDGSNSEMVAIAGPSNAAAPSWAATVGAQTKETSGLTWSNIGAVGAANTGNWFYTYTWVNPVTGDESTAAPLSLPILLPAGSGVLITGPGSTDTQVGQINIYRTTQQPTAATSGTPFLLTSIRAPLNGKQWSFVDTTPDPGTSGSILNVFITAPGYAIINGAVTNYNDPPPTGLTNLAFHAGRMWGTVGNLNFYSTGPDVTSGSGNTSWSVLNFNETPGTQMRLWPTTVGLFCMTNDGLWLVQGLGSVSNPFQPIQLVDGSISIATYDSFTINGSQALCYTSDRLYIQLDPVNGVTWLGQPVATDLIAGYDPTKVFLAYHSNGLDQKGFITNGSNQWLNWMAVPAPETGYLWGTPATVSAGAGGMQAVASVEITPGIFTLLIGPSGTGPILQRDSTFTTFSDNGSAYYSWAAFGNIVFAHHGQMAGLVFVGVDCVRLGTQPTVSCLLDEILNQVATPNWITIPNPVNDPTNLPESATLYNLRYWMIETQEPIYCRNGLFKFDFGTDTVKNELLCFTIFGESMTEEVST